MFFTREPIIESVITAKEGYKLVIRSSKGASQEDYYVDAVEIVSFGSSIFYRSLEKPKSFLLPIQDYEVLQLKEARMALKSASLEGSIKIGGGKDTAPVPQESKDVPKKKRTRRKKVSAEKPSPRKSAEESPESSQQEEPAKETASPSYLSKLLPPPPTLIKESLTKKEEQEVVEANVLLQEETPPPTNAPADSEPTYSEDSVQELSEKPEPSEKKESVEEVPPSKDLET